MVGNRINQSISPLSGFCKQYVVVEYIAHLDRPTCIEGDDSSILAKFRRENRLGKMLIEN